MKDQRKRVAKRLASGLLAGALALGGLAISGAAPAGAITPSSPTSNRLAGSDRYETAAAIARAQFPNCGSGGAVFVSGESTADALTAASLAGATRPILLVKKDSIPAATADFISDCKADYVTDTNTIFVIGGEAAISAATLTALTSAVRTATDLTPATPLRVSGANRYATSAAVANRVMTPTDTLVIANGSDGKWADAIAAGPIVAAGGWPVLLTDGTNLDATVKTEIDDWAAMPGSSLRILILGGPASVGKAVTDYLLSDAVGFVPSNLRRVGGADRYQTSLLINVYAADPINGPGLGFNTDSIALASGTSPWDALASASWAASRPAPAHVHLVPSTGSDANLLTLAGSAAALNDGTTAQNVNLWILGGKSVVPDASKIAFSAAASSGNLTATLTDCQEGQSTATLTLSGQLVANGGGNTEQTMFTTAASVFSRYEYNGADRTAGNVTITDVGFLTGVAPRQVFQIAFTGTTFNPTDVIEFEGIVEDTAYGAHTASRSIGAATCTVADDTTRPVVTVSRAYPGVVATSATNSASARWEVRFSEAVTFGTASSAANGTIPAGSLTKTTAAGVQSTNALPVDVTRLNTSGTAYLLQPRIGDTMTDFGANDVVTVNSAQVGDIGVAPNNPTAGTISATVAADTSAPVLTAGAVECTATANHSVTRGNLTFTAATLLGTGSFRGAKGYGFTMSVVNSRGLDMPTVAIDTTAKTITVTADVSYHTVADVQAVALQNGLTNVLLGNWNTAASVQGALSATVTPSVATGGTSACTVELTANEAVIIDNVAPTVNVAGLGAGFISNAATTGAAAYTAAGAFGASGAAGTTQLRSAVQVTFTTALLGSGSIVWSNTDGVTNLTDIYTTTPITFTAA